MADSKKEAARRALLKAQEKFDRDQAAVEKNRRKAFITAHENGLTHREIAEVVGFHHTRVGQIIRGK